MVNGWCQRKEEQSNQSGRQNGSTGLAHVFSTASPRSKGFGHGVLACDERKSIDGVHKEASWMLKR